MYSANSFLNHASNPLFTDSLGIKSFKFSSKSSISLLIAVLELRATTSMAGTRLGVDVCYAGFGGGSATSSWSHRMPCIKFNVDMKAHASKSVRVHNSGFSIIFLTSASRLSNAEDVHEKMCIRNHSGVLTVAMHETDAYNLLLLRSQCRVLCSQVVSPSITPPFPSWYANPVSSLPFMVSFFTKVF